MYCSGYFKLTLHSQTNCHESGFALLVNHLKKLPSGNETARLLNTFLPLNLLYISLYLEGYMERILFNSSLISEWQVDL